MAAVVYLAKEREGSIIEVVRTRDRQWRWQTLGPRPCLYEEGSFEWVVRRSVVLNHAARA